MPDFEKPSWERYRPDRVVGARVLGYRSVDSTMDIAWTVAGLGAVHGTGVRADVQRAGRGRFGRRWESGQGESLLTSTILRAPPLSPGAPVSIAASLAVLDCVAEIASQQVALKWPNDVLAGGKKIAGVLTEWRVSTDGLGIAVVGVGLNVNLDPSRYSSVQDTATSLSHLSGRALDVEAAEESLLGALDVWSARLIEDQASVVDAWRAELSTIGSEVVVRTREGIVGGTAVDVDESGCLLLRDDHGHVHVLAEGDVTLRE